MLKKSGLQYRFLRMMKKSGLQYSLGYGQSELRYSLGCGESGLWYSLGYGTVRNVKGLIVVITTVCCKFASSIFPFIFANFGMSFLTVRYITIFCHTFFIIMSEMTLVTKILESCATPNWSNGSVGQKESRSQVPDPQPQIPNPKPQILNPEP